MAAKWATACWVAGRIAEGSLDPAAGTRLIRADVAHGLGCPGELEPLVRCAHHLDGWEEGEGSVGELGKKAGEAVEARPERQAGSRAGGVSTGAFPPPALSSCRLIRPLGVSAPRNPRRGKGESRYAGEAGVRALLAGS
ncbi:hypothetical protein ACIPWL_29405 [Streptomyces sp. NPDC090023]|uniref:hypothetical protein n=1 Tax=unclassified Streptomyces TaxID=2593676 RepID=UPI00381073A5